MKTLHKNIKYLGLMILFTNMVYSQWTKVLSGGEFITTNGIDLFSYGNLMASHSSDGGEIWSTISLPCSYIKVNGAAFSGNNICIYTDCGSFLSTDTGNTWKQSSSIPFSNNMSVKGEDIYASIDSTIYISHDSGLNWVSKKIPNNKWVTTNFAFDDSIIIALCGSEIIRSTNKGNNWENVKVNGLPLGVMISRVNSLAFVNNNLFAGIDGYRFVPPGNLVPFGGLYLSKDYGLNWTQVQSLGSVRITSLQSIGNYVIAGAIPGIYFLSYDATFEKSIFDGLPANTSIRSLSVAGGKLYAGTFDGVGVWRRPINDFITSATSNTSQRVKRFELFQNYPNPFNPRTSIEFELSTRQFTVVKIMNILGQELTTLISEEMDAGKQMAIWDASEHASGVYLCLLQSGNIRKTIKLVLQK